MHLQHFRKKGKIQFLSYFTIEMFHVLWYMPLYLRMRAKKRKTERERERYNGYIFHLTNLRDKNETKQSLLRSLRLVSIFSPSYAQFARIHLYRWTYRVYRKGRWCDRCRTSDALLGVHPSEASEHRENREPRALLFASRIPLASSHG